MSFSLRIYSFCSNLTSCLEPVDIPVSPLITTGLGFNLGCARDRNRSPKKKKKKNPVILLFCYCVSLFSISASPSGSFDYLYIIPSFSFSFSFFSYAFIIFFLFYSFFFFFFFNIYSLLSPVFVLRLYALRWNGPHITATLSRIPPRRQKAVPCWMS